MICHEWVPGSLLFAIYFVRCLEYFETLKKSQSSGEMISNIKEALTKDYRRTGEEKGRKEGKKERREGEEERQTEGGLSSSYCPIFSAIHYG